MIKKILAVFLLLFLPFTAYLQVSDNDIEKMMSKRLPNREDIHYSMVSAIPSLYQANKLDTIKAITDYYEKQYGSELDVIFYKMIVSIKDRTFKEEIGNASEVDEERFDKLNNAQFYERNIMSDLWWYKRYCLATYRNPYFYSRDVREAYNDYYDFLRELAKEQTAQPGLSPVEKWLLVYFSTPSDTLYTVLSRPEYNGSALQKAWLGDKKMRDKISIGEASVITGMFFPQGNAAKLGPHPYLGITAGAKINKITIEGDLLFRAGPSAHTYTTVIDDTLRTTGHYFGMYLGADCAYQLIRKKNELALLAGLGLDGFDAANNDKNGNGAKTLLSPNFNAGLGYKINLPKRTKLRGTSSSFISFFVKYNFLAYKNAGGTDLTGNALSVGVAYGAWYNKPEKHILYMATPKPEH